MKKLVALLLVLVMALGLGACAAKNETPAQTPEQTPAEVPAETPGETPEADAYDPASMPVSICMPVMNHPVHRIVQLGFMKAAQELGYTDAQVIGTEENSNTEMFAAAEAFAAAGGKGIMLWAHDDTAYPTFRSMKEQEVVVGVAHTKHENQPEGLTFNLACDAASYGRECADFMAERLEGKTGSIAITQNIKNITENASTDAFAARIAEIQAEGKLQGVKVLDVELEGAEITQATSINTAIIQKNSDLIAAFGTTGNSPQTWAAAASKAGKADGEILIVGMDYTEANLALLNEGKVAAIVAQPLYEEAYQTMKLMDAVLRGEEVPYWTQLDAPLVYQGGEGVHDPAYYADIIAEVAEWFK